MAHSSTVSGPRALDESPGALAAPGLTAVVVTYNSEAVIEVCLQSLQQALPDAELIVVDNNSSDDTLGRCRAQGGARLLVNAANQGFGRACNQGAAAARTTHLILMNPDVSVLSADRDGLRRDLAADPLGLVGPVYHAAGGPQPMLLPDSPWFVDVMLQALGPLRPRELPTPPRLRRLATLQSARRRWPCGAMLLVNRREFLAAGGFNPHYFLYFEDRDLARRYRALGWPRRATRSVVAAHSAGGSSADMDSLRIAANGWAYLGWLEFVSEWHSVATARRALAGVRRMRAAVDLSLARLERSRVPGLAARARRKRAQLRAIDEFVRQHASRADGSALGDFYPRARLLIAELSDSR